MATDIDDRTTDMGDAAATDMFIIFIKWGRFVEEPRSVEHDGV